ncbi:hypothetical protein [Nocardia sp. NPDC051981]|uniref:hypothetical protein n=1 Tax=Nocardia sp. NPDC051981 TaxID=3155417 RepID=UPI00341FB947
MGGHVSVWVPIVVAALGFIGVLEAQLIAAWREAQIAYRTLRALMRADLGMDAEQDFLNHANITTPRQITPWENQELDPPNGSA